MSVRNTVKSIQDIMWKDVGVDGDAQRLSQLCWMFFLKIIDDQDQELELLRPGYKSPLPAPLQWRAWAADPEGITGEALLNFVNTELFPKLKDLKPTGKPGDRRRIVRDVFEDAYNYMKSGQLCRSGLLLPPLRGEKGGMRGAGRESMRCKSSPRHRKSAPAARPPHPIPLPPRGERESPAEPAESLAGSMACEKRPPMPGAGDRHAR